MKVIQGPTKWTAEVKCRCGALLQCEEVDVTTRFFGVSWGGETPEEKTCVECIVCGELIEIEVPPRIDRAAREVSRKRRLHGLPDPKPAATPTPTGGSHE